MLGALPGDGVPVDVGLVRGPARALLAAERTVLEPALFTSPGVATLTARFVERSAGNRRGDPRHAQDHSRPAGAGEGRCRRRPAVATIAWASMTPC